MATTDGWTYTGAGAGYNPTYGAPLYSTPPADGKAYIGGNPNFNEGWGTWTQSGGRDTSGNTMYALGTAQPVPAFDWRLGAWQVANRWNPQWAAQNAYTTFTDPTAIVNALATVKPSTSQNALLTAYNQDLNYLKAGQANSAMPTWYGIQQPWNQTPSTPTPTPTTGYTPAPGIPTFDWSQYGGYTATNPLQQYAGTPSWLNDPAWASKTDLAAQAEKWASVMVPWAQAQQNAYQYGQDFNEAQRRYNLERAWTQAQDQFTMDLSKQAQNYQKERDAQEFELGRQQIWGRNVAPNTRWMRSWG